MMATVDLGSNGATRTPLSEPLLTADEVAALLRVPRSTIYEPTRTRRLPHIEVGRRTLFVRVDLDAWLVANRITPRT
jgi:excisionase family DNA binding protein